MADQSKEVATVSPPATTPMAGGSAALPNVMGLRAQSGTTRSADAAAQPAAASSVTAPALGEAKVYSLLGVEFNPAKPAVEAT